MTEALRLAENARRALSGYINHQTDQYLGGRPNDVAFDELCLLVEVRDHLTAEVSRLEGVCNDLGD